MFNAVCHSQSLVAQTLATHLSAANRFPISNSIAFLYWVCSRTTCWNRLWKKNIFLFIYETLMLFFINWRQVLSKSNFSPFSGVTLDLWLQSYGLCGHFCTSSRLLGTNFEFLPLLPFRPFLLFQKKMSTRCVGGCRLLLCKNMVTHQQHWQQGQ